MRSLFARGITLFVSATLVAVLTILAITTTPTLAQEAPDNIDVIGDLTAEWSADNSSLSYLSWSFTPKAEGRTLPNLSGTACDKDTIAIYHTDIVDGGIFSNNNGAQYISVICFSTIDPVRAVDATILYYRVGDNGQFTLSNSGAIKVAPYNPNGPVVHIPSGQDSSGTTTDKDDETTTCSSEYTFGIGWAICPITNFLANSMDLLYKALSDFLVVSPLTTDQGRATYLIWGTMRNIANIMFIIGFLFIIYSQITSYGMSNYGLKRLLPRLVIAAVLVNISFWIAAIAVDISNIFGVALKDAIDGIRSGVKIDAGRDLNEITWKGTAGFVLSGGTIAAAGIAAGVGVAFSAGASLWFLLVGLAGVIMAGLVAVIILAARQALITILVIVSPLAFVAYLLPSTEKWFDRWKDIFVTLLLVYPIFSLVFGGAQLAGLAIIQGADPNNANYLNIVILGMIVQVMPVVITPLLIKVSGSLLGRIAGIVNNPNRGLVDSTRKFAQRRHDMTKNSMWASTGTDANGNIIYRRNDPLAAAARRKALRDFDYDHKLKALESGAEAAYEQDHRSHDVHLQSSINEMLKSQGADAGKAAVSREIAHTEALRRLYYQQQASHDEAETEAKEINTMYEGLKAAPSKVTTDEIEQRIGNQAMEADRRARSLAARETIAKHVQEKTYDEAITDAKNVDLREFAGFKTIDPQGVAQVVNTAQEIESKRYEALVEAGRRTLLREEATIEELDELIEKGTSSNAKFAHFSGDIESKAAAIRVFMEKAPMAKRHELAASMDLSRNAPRGTVEGIFRSEIAGGLAKNKPFHISQTHLNEMAEGRLDPIFNDVEGRNRMIAETLNRFAFDAEQMTSMDQDDIGAIADFLKSSQRSLLSADAEAQIKEALRKAFDKRDRYEGRMGKRRNNLNEVRDQLGLPKITN